MKKMMKALTAGDRKAVKVIVAVILVSAAVAILTSCEREDCEPATAQTGFRVNDDSIATHKTITFTFDGLTMESMSTRATLSEVNMTDIWLFDYIGGSLKQTIHQASTDAGFGTIALDADYGTHTLYFVAARGDTPTVSGTTISWAKPSDTFWATASLTISPGTQTTQAVTLHRVAARLRITITDQIPATLATLAVTPTVWYYGIDYLTGEATDSRATTRTISVPTSYHGTSGQLNANFYTLSPSTAWQTDIALDAKASDNSTLSAISIASVPIERNKITSYSGSLFTPVRTISLTADDTWGSEISGTW